MTSTQPTLLSKLGDQYLREYIRYGIKKAKKYHIESEKNVCHYIDLTFVLGKDFDVDPQLPWANEMLTDEHTEETIKINRLHQRVWNQFITSFSNGVSN
ncbi:MAG: hypothetical protein SVR94_09455 [Pseudomonadota bacterium]|nr:hypothetical protein [Pseudomonadota bacterium]